MALSLKDLQEAMSPLTNVGKGESTFEVLGLSVTLRALTGDEEIEVQRSARAALPVEGEVTDQVAMLEYLDKFRNGSLGYSIVAVGTLDFRGVEFIETGAKTPTGVAIKIKKHEAVQQIVATWSRSMTVAVFKKFGELMNDVEKEVDALIEFEPVDYDAEIARLEERIRELKDDKARTEASDQDIRSNIRNQVLASSAKKGKKPLTSAEEQLTTNQEAVSLSVPSDEEREVSEEDDFVPTSEASYEEETAEQESEPEAAPEAPQPVPRRPVFSRESGQLPPPTRTPNRGASSSPTGVEGEEPIRSSMVDLNDPDSAEEAIQEETARIAAMRRGRAAPHFAARQAAAGIDPAAVGKTAVETSSKETNPFSAKEIAPPDPIEPPLKQIGTKDGKEVFSMPPQVMSDRGRPPAKAPTLPNQGPPSRPNPNANPRFKPPKR